MTLISNLLERRRRRRRTRGQSLVEFALVLPLMLVLMAAVLDLGRVFYATITMNNAAREGAFQASQTPDSYQSGQACNTATNLVVCRVQLETKGSGITIAPTDIAMSCSVPGCPEQANSTVTVRVTGQFTLLTPLLSFVFGGQTMPMGAQAIAQREYLPVPNLLTLPPGPVAQCTASPSTGTTPLSVSFSANGIERQPDGLAVGLWRWELDGRDRDAVAHLQRRRHVHRHPHRHQPGRIRH